MSHDKKITSALRVISESFRDKSMEKLENDGRWRYLSLEDDHGKHVHSTQSIISEMKTFRATVKI